MSETTHQSGSTSSEPTVDGFSDTTGTTDVDSPDYGTDGRKKPMTEAEYLAAEKEIKEKGDHNSLTDRKEKHE